MLLLVVFQNPEGFDVVVFMKALISPVLKEGLLLDLGCGHGRLCGVVRPEQYIGMDLNPDAIALARKNNPSYSLEEANVSQEYPAASVCMAYTVLLHLDDDVVVCVLNNLKRAGVIHIAIAEILGREWRRGGNPPVYNRDLDGYLNLLWDAGYCLRHARQAIYQRYMNYSKKRNIWLNGLLFERRTSC